MTQRLTFTVTFNGHSPDEQVTGIIAIASYLFCTFIPYSVEVRLLRERESLFDVVV